jgi:hypothetical protein
MHIWSTYFISFLFPFMDEIPPYQFFDDQIPDRDRKRIMGFYRSMLQRHLYATGARHFVAKNPAFCAKIRSLQEFFPDARILSLARNPLDMLPSTISWINYARRVFTDPGDGYLYRDEIVQMTQHWYRHPLSYLDQNPSANHRILDYQDLIRDRRCTQFAASGTPPADLSALRPRSWETVEHRANTVLLHRDGLLPRADIDVRDILIDSDSTSGKRIWPLQPRRRCPSWSELPAPR